jgi:hypothetical protein
LTEFGPWVYGVAIYHRRKSLKRFTSGYVRAVKGDYVRKKLVGYGYYMPENKNPIAERYSAYVGLQRIGTDITMDESAISIYSWLYYHRKPKKLYQREFTIHIGVECNRDEV